MPEDRLDVDARSRLTATCRSRIRRRRQRDTFVFNRFFTQLDGSFGRCSVSMAPCSSLSARAALKTPHIDERNFNLSLSVFVARLQSRRFEPRVENSTSVDTRIGRDSAQQESLSSRVLSSRFARSQLHNLKIFAPAYYSL